MARFPKATASNTIVRDNAWHYRDYVIKAFNDDKPYADFVKEQISGDTLNPPTREGLIATGFLVAGPWDEAGNTSRAVRAGADARETNSKKCWVRLGRHSSD